MKNFGAVLLVVLAALVVPGVARAECSTTTRQTLNAALTSYTRWQNDSASSVPAEKGLAAPEWESFEREMDWIVDHGDMARCSRSTQLLYYSFSASRDAMRMARLYALRQGDVAITLDEVLTKVVNAALDLYYADVRELYYLGYARTSPAQYAHFKGDLSGWYTTTGVTFTSWEKTPPIAKAVPRKCAQRDQPARVVSLFQPAFPEPAKETGLGKITVGVTVLVGPSGNVVDARVTDTSFNAAMDNAAIGGALLSTYVPAIRNCQPAMATLVVNFQDQPD